MLGIYSLIWTICYKLMWFYWNTVLFHIIFLLTHGEIFGHLGHTGPLTVKTKWRCRRCIGGDCVVFLLLLKEIRLQLSQKASQQVLLQYVSHTAETDKVSLVLWSTVSQNLRPLGAARTMWVYFALCQQSTLKSQNSGCLVLEVLAKLMVGENSSWEFPKVGVCLILEVRLILETRWYIIWNYNPFRVWVLFVYMFFGGFFFFFLSIFYGPH